MAWTDYIVPALAAGQGLYDLYGSGSNSAQGISSAAAAAADPFSSQRGQYQGMLQGLMSGQNFTSDPSYQARFNAGQQAIERSAAARGMLGSGNLLTELTKYGQEQASGEYQNQFARLAKLAGVDAGSPGEAGRILAGRYGQRNNALANIGGSLGSSGGQQALGALGSLAQQYFGGGSGGGAGGMSSLFGGGSTAAGAAKAAGLTGSSVGGGASGVGGSAVASGAASGGSTLYGPTATEAAIDSGILGGGAQQSTLYSATPTEAAIDSGALGGASSAGTLSAGQALAGIGAV